MDEKRLYETLFSTCPYEDNDRTSMSEKIFDSIKKDETVDSISGLSKNRIVNRIEVSMISYLVSSRRSIRNRQRTGNAFQIWLQRICRELGVEEPENKFPEYVKNDQYVELIKELHDRNGLTINELAEKFSVHERTIRNRFQQLCPGGNFGGNNGQQAYYFGGQALYANIEKTDSDEGVKFMNEPSVHPLVFQYNVQQLCALLRALCHANNSKKYGKSNYHAELAMDVWFQLSEYGKNKVKEIAKCNHDRQFMNFLDDLNEITESNRNIEYRTEEDLSGYGSVRDQLEYAYKNRKAFRATIRRDGKKTVYTNIRLICINQEGLYEASKDNGNGGRNSFSFDPDDIYGYIDFEDK